MEVSMIASRKFYVVITNSLGAQQELETLLGNGRYHNFPSPQADVFIEGLFPLDVLSDLVTLTPPENTGDRECLSAHDQGRGGIGIQGSNGLLGEQLLSGSLPLGMVTMTAPCVYSGLKVNDNNWRLDPKRNELKKNQIIVALTAIESTLLETLLKAKERLVSKNELVRSIGREPDQYQGLEMCLSRLQEKFKRVSRGERLFRAVRNRGYCLIQNIISEG